MARRRIPTAAAHRPTRPVPQTRPWPVPDNGDHADPPAARWQAPVVETPESRTTWLAIWLIRALLGAGIIFALLERQAWPTVAGVVALGLSFAPRAVERATRTDLPGWLELTWIAAVALPGASTAFGLYDRITHWGKLVHGADAFLVALLVGVLLLGYREARRIDLSDQLGALLTVFVGVAFGVLWELVEYVFDWVADTSLQKSNADTMTDFLWHDLGTVLATLLAVRLFCHWLGAADRRAVGVAGGWLVDGPSRLLDRHGWLMTLLVSAIIALAVAALWFAGRPIPGLPSS